MSQPAGKCVLRKLRDSNPHLAAEALRNGFLGFLVIGGLNGWDSFEVPMEVYVFMLKAKGYQKTPAFLELHPYPK